MQDRHVERAAAEVVDRDLMVALLVESVCERGGRGLVDDAEHFESRHLAGVFRGLPLGVVEVCRNGDDGLCYFLAKIVLGGLSHLLQDHGRYLGRGERLAARLDDDVVRIAAPDLVGHKLFFLGHLVVTASHEPLDRKYRVLGIRYGLPFGHRADEPLAGLRERDDRRRRAAALGVGQHGRLAALHDRHAGVGCSQIDTDYLSHSLYRLQFDA